MEVLLYVGHNTEHSICVMESHIHALDNSFLAQVLNQVYHNNPSFPQH